MTTRPNLMRIFSAFAATLLLASCQKSDRFNSAEEDLAATAIPVAASASSLTVSGSTTVAADSVYLVNACSRRGRRDSVAPSSLPAGVQTYLTASYAGATFHKAFAVKDASGNLTHYAVVVYYNDKPVGLLFDTAGNFVRVLEQREKGDLRGRGHHRGGRFEHRDGQGRDSVALSALPTAVTAYFAANYPADTLVKAFRGKDNFLAVLSKNNGLFVTVFNSSNGFVKREQAHRHGGHHVSIELSALPSSAAAYLSQTYPNYVFNKAFSIGQGASLKGYVVIIDANNTRYAVLFSSSGAFVEAKVIR